MSSMHELELKLIEVKKNQSEPHILKPRESNLE